MYYSSRVSGMKWWEILMLGAAIALALFGAYYFFFWTEDAKVEVVAHHWRRVINIEDYQVRSGSDWDNRVPSGAYNISCRRKWRNFCDDDDLWCEEYDDWCTYSIDRWEFARRVVASGANKTDPRPYWPEFTLAVAGNDGYGAERERNRTELYELILAHDERADHCGIGEAWWSKVEIGAGFDVEVRKHDNSVVCGSLSKE